MWIRKNAVVQRGWKQTKTGYKPVYKRTESPEYKQIDLVSIFLVLILIVLVSAFVRGCF